MVVYKIYYVHGNNILIPLKKISKNTSFIGYKRNRQRWFYMFMNYVFSFIFLNNKQQVDVYTVWYYYMDTCIPIRRVTINEKSSLSYGQ